VRFVQLLTRRVTAPGVLLAWAAAGGVAPLHVAVPPVVAVLAEALFLSYDAHSILDSAEGSFLWARTAS
jgi:hypothetical protein